MTPGQLADRVGIKLRSIYNIELNNRPAGTEVLVKLARTLGVKVDEILKHDAPEPAEAAALRQ